MSVFDDRLLASRKYLNAIVHNSNVNKLFVLKLVEDTMFEIQKLLESGLESNIQSVLDKFKAKLLDIIEDNMSAAISLAEERADAVKGTYAGMLKDIETSENNLNLSKAVESYRQNIKEEIDYFIKSGYPSKDLSAYIIDPLSYIALHEGNQGEFKESVPSINKGCSYKIMSTIWAILNFSSVKAHNIMLSTIWKASGVIGYIGYRSTNIDCPLCDEYCGRLWPINGEMWFPVHPYCVCSVVEVRAGEILE